MTDISPTDSSIPTRRRAILCDIDGTIALRGTRDPYDFDSFSGKSSLPSGHTSTAFCLATVISSEYKSGLVATAAYGTATMVGFSRLYRDVHWASDVVVSAVLGVAIGKATHDLYGTNPRNWEIILDGQGAKVSRKF